MMENIKGPTPGLKFFGSSRNPGIRKSLACVAGGREREARNTACPKTTHSEFRPPNAWSRPSYSNVFTLIICQTHVFAPVQI